MTLRHATSAASILVGALSVTFPSHAAPTLRIQVDQHGDFVLTGNTLGWDCASEGTPAIPAPTFGVISNCSAAGSETGLGDTAPDIFWRSDDDQATADGESDANGGISAANARSTAMLELPVGATVTHAYLLWGANIMGDTADPDATMERPGPSGGSLTASAVSSYLVPSPNNTPGGGNYYQSVADVTAFVAQFGPGAYRVGGVDSRDLRGNASVETAFAAWSLVVFYELASEPLRNLAFFDGLDLVSNGAPANVSLTGFLVPSTGYDAKFGVIAYEGDATWVGDSLLFNGTKLTDVGGDEDNFFNGTRSTLGAAVSLAGDLPRLTGGPRSLAGIDIDVVDVTALVSSGDDTAVLSATSSVDIYSLGAFVTSIATYVPNFVETEKWLANLTRQDGHFLRGDVIEYTVTTTNTGNDEGMYVVLSDIVPTGLDYVAESILVASGPNPGVKTDAPGDDQGRFDVATRTVVVNLGTGASATEGGSLEIGESTTVTFQATISDSATGTLSNQASISAEGLMGNPETSYPSHDGASDGATTDLLIDDCLLNADCVAPEPFCDTSVAPYHCVECLANADCSSTPTTPYCKDKVCEPCEGDGAPSCMSPEEPACHVTTGACVPCSATEHALCNTLAAPTCIVALGLCGCNTDADCGATDSGRVCNAGVTPALCQDGCRGTDGNGCPAELICTSSDASIGTCTFGPDGGAGGTGGDGANGGLGGHGAAGGGHAGTGGTGAQGANGGTGGAGASVGGDPGPFVVTDPLAEGGCACWTAGERRPSRSLGAVGALAALGAVVARRRRR
jgi:fimbrial isopeptide formation D2 family protein